MGDPFPQNCPFSWGSGPPSIHDSLGHHHNPNDMTISLAVFRTGDNRVSLHFTMGTLSPKKCPSQGRSGPQFNTILWVHLSLQPKRHLDWFSCFCIDDRRVSLYFTMGRPILPPNYPFPYGIWTPI